MTGRNAGAGTGYSGTPLPRKLGIKPGSRVGLIEAPEGFEDVLGPTEAATVERTHASSSRAWDVLVYFVTRRADLSRDFGRLSSAIDLKGAVWIAWPKRSSGVETDLTENILREVCLPTGMVDNKVCAIDEIWSGLRFVWRVENRPLTR